MNSPHLAPIHLRFDSDPAHLEDIRLKSEALAKAIGFDDRAIGEIGLCVNEAIANVIEHAYKFEKNRPIEFWAEHVPPAHHGGAPGIRVKVRDWGPGLDPSKLPQKPKDPLVPKGLGIICMKEMTDSMVYVPQTDGGVVLELVRRVDHVTKRSEDVTVDPAAGTDGGG
jgi:serine/threonine-protein kinase RsbW